MGVAALAAAIPAGLLTALVLTGVINRRAFGWQIDLHLTAAQFTDALWLAPAAALAAGGYPAGGRARGPPAPGLRGGGGAAAGAGGGAGWGPPARPRGAPRAPGPPPPRR